MQIWTGPQFSFLPWANQPAASFGMLGMPSAGWPGGLAGTALESSFMGPGCNPGLLAQMLGQSIGTGGSNCPQAAWQQMMQQAPMFPGCNGNASWAMMMQMLPNQAGNANLATQMQLAMLQLGQGSSGNANLATQMQLAMLQLGQGSSGNANLATQMQLAMQQFGQGSSGNANLATQMQLAMQQFGQGSSGNANLATQMQLAMQQFGQGSSGNANLATQMQLAGNANLACPVEPPPRRHPGHRPDHGAIRPLPQPHDPRMTEQDAARNLYDYREQADQAAGIGGADHQIGREDLQALVDGRDTPDAVRRSARFMLENDPLFHDVDGASSDGHLDNLLSFDDLKAVMDRPQATHSDQAMTLGLASQTVRDQFDLLDTAGGHDRDGLVDQNDLKAVLASPDAPDDVRRACQYLLDNPAMRNGLDTASGQGRVDGLISRQDADEAARQFAGLDESQRAMPTDLRSASQVLEQYMNVADTASGRGRRDGLAGKLDLQALLNSPDAPPQLRESARLLLDNPSYFNRVDGAGALFGMLDNRFTLGDLQITAQA